MTVQELKERLEQMSPDSEIMVWDSVFGNIPATRVTQEEMFNEVVVVVDQLPGSEEEE